MVKICKIKVKPPQSGKTNDAIIKPMDESIKNGRIPIIIIPSRIQLQQQLSNRINVKVGTFDTGSPNSFKNIIDALECEEIKALVILNNVSGLKKLICFMLQKQIKKPDVTFDIIVDEAHHLFGNTSNISDDEIYVIRKGWDAVKYNKKVTPLTLNTTKVGLIIWLIDLIVINKDWTISGTTATVSYITQCKLNEKLNLQFLIVKLKIPNCYIGYDSIKKQEYEDIETTFRSIINSNNKCCIVIHAGRTNKNHEDMKDLWFKNSNNKKSCVIIVDKNGYTLNTKDKCNTLKKNTIKEPWQVRLIKYTQDFNYIIFIGDQCVSESNTYQKCDKDYNLPVNHLIITKIPSSMSKMTSSIQKIGRIFGNDTSGKYNERTIWIPKINKPNKDSLKTIIQNAFELEKSLQNIGEKTSLTDINYHEEERKIINKNKTTRTKRLSYTDLIDRFTNYKLGNSNIAKFIRSLNMGYISYSEEHLLKLLSKAGYKQPKSFLKSVTSTSGYGIQLFDITDNKGVYIPLSEVKLAHKAVFDT